MTMKKKKILVILSVVIFYMLSSCSDSNVELAKPVENISKGVEMENIAKLLASMDLDNEEVRKVHSGVNTALDKGLHEVYFMKELMSEDFKVVKEVE